MNVAGNIVRRVGHGADSFAGLWFGPMPLVIGLLFVAAGIAMVRKGWRRFQED